VAGASSQQSKGLAQINAAVSQIDKVTQSNAANAEESAAASEELNAQAEMLKSAVADLGSLIHGHQERDFSSLALSSATPAAASSRGDILFRGPRASSSLMPSAGSAN